MDERNNDFDFDFMPIGQAIKKAREARGMTREQLSGIIGYAPRHIQSIENEGKYPSIELFIQLITMFDVSVDEYIFPNKEVKKSSVRRRLDAQLDNLDDKEAVAHQCYHVILGSFENIDEAAEKLNLGVSAIESWRKNINSKKFRCPKLENIILIAEKTGRNITDLF